MWFTETFIFLFTAIDPRLTRVPLSGENRFCLHGFACKDGLSIIKSHSFTAAPANRTLFKASFFIVFSDRKIIDVHVNSPGHVDSPGFPDSPYPSNAYMQWKFRADPGHRIQLDFQDLILEDDCQRDFIKIYDSLAPIEKRTVTE